MDQKLNIDEKIKLLVAKDMWSNDSCGGKLYSFVVSDGPVGLRHPQDMNSNDHAVCSIAYPSTQMLSHTWNLELAREMGNALANDCIENDVDIILAPGVNIKRIPTCGRNFEYFSEDPLLAGLMAREYIAGVQEKHVGTSLKHFCCNNMEYSRHWMSSEVDERTLREIYLRQFEIACEAKPWTIMCSYNLVNGMRMSEHQKLYDVLRNEFGFDGLIMSDWDAVKDRIASLNAGLDIEMPHNKEHLKSLYRAKEEGTLPLEKVEECSARVITLADRCEKSKKIRKVDMTTEERERIALKIEEEGIVLLKNDNHILPLRTEEKVLVTGGPLIWHYFGGGSSQISLRSKYVNLHAALSKFMPNVAYSESVLVPRGHSCDIGNLKGAVAFARGCDVSIICVGDNDVCEAEGHDRQHIKLAKEEEDTICAIAKVSKKTVVVVYAGSAIDMSAWIDKVDAVIWAGYGGEYVNEALAEVLVGKVNPSGKLTETFPLALYDVPAMNTYRDEVCVMYSEGLNIGYRYFNTFEKPVLFPFGYGLSYSEFKYSDLKIERDENGLTISFELENISDVDGKEIAQIYICELCKEVYRPNKELRAFKKVFVSAHGKVRVEIPLDDRAFAYYSVANDAWKIHGGQFEIQVCSDVESVKLSQTVDMKEKLL